MRVLIAIDDSQYACAAVQSVVNRPWWGDTQFLIVSVVQLLSSSFCEFPGQGNVILEAEEAQRAQVRKLVESTVQYVRKIIPICSVAGQVREGSIVDEIIQAATEWGAEFIVMGSHGRSGLTKFLLGSVAESVLHRAPCSVEIVRMVDVAQKKQRHKACAAA